MHPESPSVLTRQIQLQGQLAWVAPAHQRWVCCQLPDNTDDSGLQRIGSSSGKGRADKATAGEKKN